MIAGPGCSAPLRGAVPDNNDVEVINLMDSDSDEKAAEEVIVLSDDSSDEAAAAQARRRDEVAAGKRPAPVAVDESPGAASRKRPNTRPSDRGVEAGPSTAPLPAEIGGAAQGGANGWTRFECDLAAGGVQVGASASQTLVACAPIYR